MTDKTFKVTAWPSGKVWIIQVEGFDQPTQARSVKEIDTMVRDFIHVIANIPLEDVRYQLSYLLPDGVEEALQEAARLREVSDRARKDAAAASSRAAKMLHQQGFKVRDIGAALGISFQRAQQLLNR
jgi:hypothetical protein